MATHAQRRVLALVSLVLCTLLAGLLLAAEPKHIHEIYLGFDRNEYPGDDTLAQLRKTFAFTGYWLSVPPGANTNSWSGKRAIVAGHHFGFLLLFNGRLYRDLKAPADAQQVGRTDAAAAVTSAIKEGFPKGLTIFLDQEEGGTLLAEQFAYIAAWSDGVRAAGFRPGVYCSGISVQQQGRTVTTATDLRTKLAGRQVKLWVANDQCPPSPGCSYEHPVPNPAASGTPDALVWQFAQSPRRPQFTDNCAVTYAADRMCYAPGLAAGPQSFLDLNSSNSPDPSSAR